MTGDYIGARQRFEESIGVGYLSFVAHYLLGFLADIQGDTKEAHWQYNRVLEVSAPPDGMQIEDINILGYRALALVGLGQWDMGKAILSTLDNSASDSGEVLCNMARAWAVMGERSRAQELLSRAFAAHMGPTDKEVSLDPHFRSIPD